MIKKHLGNLRWMLYHKYFVMIECFKVGLFLQGMTHDLSKFLPSEWFPYAEFWYGNGKSLDEAWLFHQHRNKHHWQYWILREDEGKIKVLDMPLKYKKEMLCDWKGVGKGLGKGNDVRKWYSENKDKMLLHSNTRKWIEENI